MERAAAERTGGASRLRATTIDQLPATITYDSQDPARLFVVSGAAGYFIELDLKLKGSSATDEGLDEILG